MTTGDNSPIPDYLSKLRLDGRSYVVAGAGVGMGRHSTHALAQAGAQKIICVDVEADRAKEIADEVGDVAIPWVGDVTDPRGRGRAGGVRRGRTSSASTASSTSSAWPSGSRSSTCRTRRSTGRST